MAKRKNNVQVVKGLMEFSKHGALTQMFIMEAIGRYAKQCAAADPKVFDNGFINGEAWVSCAKEISETLEAHYAS